MKIEQWEKAKKHLTRPGQKILKDSPITKKDIEKTIATFGNPKSKGKWAEFVKKNKKLDLKKELLMQKPMFQNQNCTLGNLKMMTQQPI